MYDGADNPNGPSPSWQDLQGRAWSGDVCIERMILSVGLGWDTGY